MFLSLMLSAVLSEGTAASGFKPCAVVEGEAIVAGNLAPHVPQLRLIDPLQVLARSPQLGIRRVFSARELNVWMKRYAAGAELVSPNVSACAVRNSMAVDTAGIREAIRAAFGLDRKIDVAILDFSGRQVDQGSLRFPLESLPRPTASSEPVIWRGWHIAKSGQRTPVWAKVLLSERVQAVFADVELIAGQPISSDAVFLRETSQFPPAQKDTSPLLASIVGKTPLKGISKGALVSGKELGTPMAVRRGDAVEVEVSGSFIRLTFAGKAENSGKAGQRISISSQISRRMFQAVIQEKGHVIVPIEALPSSRP